MNAYVEIIFQHAMFRHYLTDDELQEIGEFTRENVARFSNDRNRTWAEYASALDLHAVCGGIIIPWAEEKYRQGWDEHFPEGWDKWLADYELAEQKKLAERKKERGTLTGLIKHEIRMWSLSRKIDKITHRKKRA